MASSEVDICNSALIHLGAEPITSLADNSDQARASNQFYDGARDAVLTQADWTFATTQQELSKDASTPLFKYAYQYHLPNNPYCLKPLFMSSPENDDDWKVQGRMLLTDRDGVYLQYIFRQTDVSAFTSLFVICLEYFLAHRMAYAVTGSRAVAADMYELFLNALADAQSVDAQTGYPEDFEADYLLRVRT